MNQLFYISNINKALSFKDLAERPTIQNLRYNEDPCLSGILLFHSGICLQLLEGSEESLLRVFEEIKRDPINQNVTLLFSRQCEQRLFPNWSCYAEDGDKVDARVINEFLSWNKLISKNSLNNENVAYMISRFKSFISVKVMESGMASHQEEKANVSA